MTFSRVPQWMLHIVYGFCRLWWMFTQALTYKPKYKLPELKDVGAILTFMNYGNSYVPDPLGGRWDTMFHVTHTTKKILTANEKMSLDCEDHAAVWAAALTENHLARVVSVGAVWFLNPDGKTASGHAVCVYQSHEGGWFWCDYGEPRAFTDQWDWAHQASKVYDGKLLYCAKFEVKNITDRGFVHLKSPVVHKA